MNRLIFCILVYGPLVGHSPWVQFPGLAPVLASAVIDRIVYRSETVHIEGGGSMGKRMG